MGVTSWLPLPLPESPGFSTCERPPVLSATADYVHFPHRARHARHSFTLSELAVVGGAMLSFRNLRPRRSATSTILMHRRQHWWSLEPVWEDQSVAASAASLSAPCADPLAFLPPVRHDGSNPANGCLSPATLLASLSPSQAAPGGWTMFCGLVRITLWTSNLLNHSETNRTNPHSAEVFRMIRQNTAVCRTLPNLSEGCREHRKPSETFRMMPKMPEPIHSTGRITL